MEARQFTPIFFDELSNPAFTENLACPFGYYLLLTRYIWRIPQRPKHPAAPPVHEYYQKGELPAYLPDSRAAEMLGVSKRTIIEYRKKILGLGWIKQMDTQDGLPNIYSLGTWEIKDGDKPAESLYRFTVVTPAGDTNDHTGEENLTGEENFTGTSEENFTGTGEENFTPRIKNNNREKRIVFSSQARNLNTDNSDFEEEDLKRVPFGEEFEDDDLYSRKKIKKSLLPKGQYANLCLELFADRGKKQFSSEAEKRGWREIDQLLVLGKINEAWVRHRHEEGMKPQKKITPTGRPLPRWTFLQFCKFTIDVDKFKEWEINHAKRSYPGTTEVLSPNMEGVSEAYGSVNNW